MKKILLAMGLAVMPLLAFAQKENSIVGRQYKYFDTSAFCSYGSFHPSEYLTDNNWDILCAFVEPGTVAKLDSLAIPYSKSQLRLLEVGDLLRSDNGVYSTSMKIFDKSETDAIRRQSKAFADSIFPVIEPKVARLIKAFSKAGYSGQTYSLVFSYLLDSYVWGDGRLPKPVDCGDHGTWSGVYWAMFDSRAHDKIGTNGYGPVMQNWTDSLGYWIKSDKMISFAKEVMKTKGKRIENQAVIDAVAGWGLTDEKGNIRIPVMHASSNDDIDVLCRSIADELTDAVKAYCSAWCHACNISSEKVEQIIFYHEVMWDLLEILEAKGMISMPPILKGEEVGKQHFGDICFIVITDENDSAE